MTVFQKFDMAGNAAAGWLESCNSNAETHGNICSDPVCSLFSHKERTQLSIRRNDVLSSRSTDVRDVQK